MSNELGKVVLSPQEHQQAVEFNRFKQDCRKRALDMGIIEVERNGSAFTSKEVTEAAEKYYQWLIKEV